MKHLDMERVMERFQHYGQLYGDAPASAADERERRVASPISSSVRPSLGATLESVREGRRTAHSTLISQRTRISRDSLGLSPRGEHTIFEHRKCFIFSSLAWPVFVLQSNSHVVLYSAAELGSLRGDFCGRATASRSGICAMFA